MYKMYVNFTVILLVEIYKICQSRLSFVVASYYGVPLKEINLIVSKASY